MNDEPLIRKATPEEREAARLTVRDFEFWNAGYEEGMRVAIKSPSEGLDVDRLARALPVAFARFFGNSEPNPDYDRSVDHRWAEAIAAEYGRSSE